MSDLPPDGFEPDHVNNYEEHPPDGYADTQQHGFVDNALSDIGDIASGIGSFAKKTMTMPMDFPIDIYQTGKGLIQGQPFNQTPIGQQAGQLGDMVANALPHPNPDKPLGWNNVESSLTENILHPYQHPVKAALDVASFGAPFLKGARVPLLSDAAEGASNLGRTIARKVTSNIFDVPEAAISKRYANPAAIRNAASTQELALNEVPRIANKFDQGISGLHTEAKKTLSTSRYLQEAQKSKTSMGSILQPDKGGAFTKDEVLGAIASARKNLGGVYTPEAQSAANTLSKISGNLNKVRNTVSQNQVHDLIRDLDREIPWEKVRTNPQDLTLADNALIETRTKLDGILKKKNPAYAEIMKPMSDLINSRNQYLKNFSLKRIKGGGYEPSDTTVSRLSGATNDNKLATQRILGKTKENIGEDLMPQIENAQTKEAFQPQHKRSETVFGAARQMLSSPPTAGKLVDFASKAAPQISDVGKALKPSYIASRVLDETKAREYLKKAGGDKNKARQMATQDGWTW